MESCDTTSKMSATKKMLRAKQCAMYVHVKLNKNVLYAHVLAHAQTSVLSLGRLCGQVQVDGGLLITINPWMFLNNMSIKK